MQYTALYRDGPRAAIQTKKCSGHAHITKRSYAEELKRDGFRVVCILTGAEIKIIKAHRREDPEGLLLKYPKVVVSFVGKNM